MKEKIVEVEINGLKYRLKEARWNALTEENKRLIREFDYYNQNVANKGNGLKNNSRIGNIDSLIKFAIYINKPFIDVKDDQNILHKFFREDFKKELKQWTIICFQ